MEVASDSISDMSTPGGGGTSIGPITTSAIFSTLPDTRPARIASPFRNTGEINRFFSAVYSYS
ncbi:MAG: hypothetical protein KDI29_17490 [Pseudomonadales bacterium]|nr:hypothetical protein [Pseudomonadales bacterium]